MFSFLFRVAYDIKNPQGMGIGGANAMDSSYLLVIDKSADHAQVVNSYLRNAGLAVRVVNASNLNDLEGVLKQHSPFLILLGTKLPASLKVRQILQTADQYSTPVALQVIPEKTGIIDAALATHSVTEIGRAHV